MSSEGLAPRLKGRSDETLDAKKTSRKKPVGRQRAQRRSVVPTAAAEPQSSLLHRSIYGVLRQRFVTGAVRPGETISTRGVAASLGVSQMPVREALARLAAEGAVEIRSKRKIVVPTMTADRFHDLLRCRQLLESEAAEAAFPFIDRHLLRRLRATDKGMNVALKAGDVTAYMEGNYHFHFLIYRAQPRQTLVQLIETLWLQFGPYMRVVYGRFGTANLVDQHRVAVDSIAAGDAAGLVRAIATDISDGMGLIGPAGLESQDVET